DRGFWSGDQEALGRVSHRCSYCLVDAARDLRDNETADLHADCDSDPQRGDCLVSDLEAASPRGIVAALVMRPERRSPAGVEIWDRRVTVRRTCRVLRAVRSMRARSLLSKRVRP